MNSSNQKILIVDDIEDNRFTLERRLTRNGYTAISQADCGKKALELVKEESFDLVELNLKDNQKDREISVVKKEKTNKKIKALTEKEIKKIKKDIKKKRTKERIVKKKQNTKEEKLKVTKNKKIPKKGRDIVNKNNNKLENKFRKTNPHL